MYSTLIMWCVINVLLLTLSIQHEAFECYSLMIALLRDQIILNISMFLLKHLYFNSLITNKCITFIKKTGVLNIVGYNNMLYKNHLNNYISNLSRFRYYLWKFIIYTTEAHNSDWKWWLLKQNILSKICWLNLVAS